VGSGIRFDGLGFSLLASKSLALVLCLAWAEGGLGCATPPSAQPRMKEAANVVVAAERLRRGGEPAKALVSLETARGSCRSAGDPRCETLILVGLGEYHSATGTPDAAKAECERARVTLEMESDPQGKAMALSCLAGAALATGAFDEARKAAAAAGVLAQDVQNGRVAGWAAARGGEALAHLGRNEEARELLVAAQKHVGDATASAEISRELAMVQRSLGDKRGALAPLQVVLDAFSRLGDLAGQATTLNNLGNVSSDLGDKQTGIDFFNRALPLQRAVMDRAGEAATFADLAELYSALGEKPKAFDLANQALLIQRAVGDRNGEATTLSNIGAMYDDLGEKEKALDFYTQALSIQRALGTRAAEGITLNNIGKVYDDIGERQKALDFYNQALTLKRAVGDRTGEAITLNNIGTVYFILGQKQKALDFFSQALPIHRAVGNRNQEATTLTNIAVVYSSLGENAKALDFYNQALPIRRAVGDRFGEAKTLANIGRAYSALGDKRKALDFYNQALPVHRAVGDRASEGRTLGLIGRIHDDLGEAQTALDIYRQALPLLRAVKDTVGEGIMLDNIGRAYSALGQTQKALDAYSQALPIERAGGDRSHEAATLYFIAALLGPSSPNRAIFHAKQAVNLYQSLRRDIRGLPPDVQRTYASTVASSYRGLADLLAGQGRLGEAQRVLELLKDQEFFEYVRRDEKAVSGEAVALRSDEKAASIHYDALAGTITRLGTEYGELQRKASRTSEEETRFAKIGKQLEGANAAFLDFLRGLSSELSHGTERVRSIYDASSALRRVLGTLEPGTVAVFTLVGEKKLRTILVTANVRKGYTHATELSAAELGKEVLALREALQDRSSDPRPLARKLYDALVKPMATDLAGARASTILWYLDGPLRYVPMGALFDGSAWLVEKYRSVVLSGGGLTGLQSEPRAPWTALAFGVTQAHEDFPALPGVSAEVEAVVGDGKAVRGALEGEGLLDARFTDAALMDIAHRHPAVVHVASHFVFRPGDEASSFLLLGDGTHLTLGELRKRPPIFAKVDLLTLSACNTAVEGGEGTEVDGLARIAEEKGAAAVLATLWPVSDVSTPAFIRRFYTLREELGPTGKKRTKAAALQQAQKEMSLGAIPPSPEGPVGMGDGPTDGHKDALPGWTHPYYWASFVLLGNGR
jgi:CHAT domain-containing protein/Tfp pilus assembly protein PilF/predicted negative regulator of RcsB-dependent stress response